ncbi:MAG: carbohydrate ABC transporter permease [Oscillospiraceae bacterium]
MTIKRFLKIVFSLLTAVLLLLVFFVPFYWMIVTSIKSVGEVLLFPPSLWPESPQWDNFLRAVTAVPFAQYTVNSMVVTLGILVCQLVTVIPAAYAFARYRFRGRSFFFGLTMTTMMIPGQLIFLPIFLLFSKWGLINSYATLILPFASSAFGIFMLRQSFMRVPEEIIEAARMDHAGELQIMFKIMLPISRPTVVTLALFTFISAWNDYFWPLVMTTTDAVRTLPLAIAALKTVDSGITYHLVMAGNVLMILPIAAAFILAQKQFIRAFTYSGEK